MNGAGSIFLDFQLPTAATWFYFSGLLAAALFVRFSRLLSVRNWDVLTLFLFAPGFLLLLESHGDNRWGYAWLLITSGYFFLRCLGDLALVRRPALGPNLNLSGLACLAAALSASLVAVAVQNPRTPNPTGDAARSPIDEMLVNPKTLEKAPAEVVGFTVPIGAARALALLCHLSVVVGLVLIGWKHFADVLSGMAAATFYLLLPYTYLLTPNSALGLGRWDMVWPMAWMVWAVFCYRRPVLAGVFLGVAAGGVLLPVLTLPAWLSFYRKRGAGRFFLAFAVAGGLTLAAAAGVLCAVGLPQDWQLVRGAGPLAGVAAAADQRPRRLAGRLLGLPPAGVHRLRRVRDRDAVLADAEEPGPRRGAVGRRADRHPVLVRRQRRRLRAVVSAVLAAAGVPAEPDGGAAAADARGLDEAHQPALYAGVFAAVPAAEAGAGDVMGSLLGEPPGLSRRDEPAGSPGF